MIQQQRLTSNAFGELGLEAKPQQFTLINGVPGTAKSVTTESKVEKYHKDGYLIINLLEVKDKFETCFPMFKPQAEWHKFFLKEFDIEPKEKKVKIYHPFTFSIPHKRLPDINFFTFPIKSLNREDISLLLEAHSDTESVKLILNILNELPDDYGFYEFLFELRKVVERSTKINKQETSNNSFGFDIPPKSSATNLGEIYGSLKAFENNFMLSNSKNELNLNVKKIFEDQESYHTLVTKWIGRSFKDNTGKEVIPDNKLKYFAIQKFFRTIINNIDKCDYPICFVVEELRKFTPKERFADNYQNFVAKTLSDEFNIMRNKNCVIVANTQSLFDVNDSVLSAFNMQYIMQTKAKNDESILQKAYGMSSRLTAEIGSLNKGEFKVNDERNWNYTFVAIPPSHGHKEPHDDFFKLYNQFYPEKLKIYKEIITTMKDNAKLSKEHSEELWKEFKVKIEQLKPKKYK